MRSQQYWDVCPQLRQTLFRERRPGYVDLAVDKAAINPKIYEHPEFEAFIAGMNDHFAAWRKKTAATLKALKAGCHPKEVIGDASESLLAHYAGKPLIDPYDVYQHLMDYWAETMQDDMYSSRLTAGRPRPPASSRRTRRARRRTRAGPATSSQSPHRRPLLRQGAGGDRPARR